MNIKQAKQEIKNTVKAYLMKDEAGDYLISDIRQRPILMIGPPGIGKTQIMEQIARECRIGLVSYTITHHTRQSAVGLPFIKEEEFEGKLFSVTEYTMSEIISSIYRRIRDYNQKEGILFIDEINCVSETLAPMMLNFLQCKTFGNQRIPKGWIIVAAGNPPQYNKSVREFDIVTLDRVRKIEVQADFPVWKEYARDVSVNDAIISYLSLRQENFYRIESDVDGMRFVTARGWEDLSSLMEVYFAMNVPVNENVIYEYIQHEDVARDVAAYIDLYNKYRDDYGINEILMGNVDSEVYQRIYKASFDERLSVVQLIISGLNVYFKLIGEMRFVIDKWYEFLKEFKRKIDENMDEECYGCVLADIYREMYQTYECEILSQKAGDMLSKKDIENYQELLGYLKQGIDILDNLDKDCNKDNAFENVKAIFDDMVTELRKNEEKTVLCINNAFDFMENAFKNGSEMSVFVTELTMNSDSALFLAENTCEPYLKYSRELMTGTKKAELLARISEDDIRKEEHIRDF